ncbi:hypothetical protein GCM10009837_28040 [Streptomyces durmitorensis]|uniref:Secreted protein n=1 Tax=Streptomyces durmitorensis TaxID=319947 RepID=A0ABY4PTM5_9ACTN|nr:hypothetical protein [Streptomyces durmitorensis]UQT56554.1 hypothetical protein M4V62_16420 [Streptomyces durmitorensis]
MKTTTRVTLAALLAGVSAATAAPAQAAEHAPVAIPLNGLEWALDTQAPEISTGVPIPIPGGPDQPRFDEDRLLPERELPQFPVSTDLPATRVVTPLDDALGEVGFDRMDVATRESDVRTSTPGASLNAPATGPRPDHFGLPGAALPQAALHAPLLQAQPGADLGLS